MALLQTVQVFAPESQSENAYGGGSIKGAQCLPLGSRGPWAPEYEERAPTTVRRKVSEEVLEADVTNKGAGRVTGKGWWTGVDAGGQGQWECSLQVPVRLTRIERQCADMTAGAGIYSPCAVDRGFLCPSNYRQRIDLRRSSGHTHQFLVN